MDSQRDRVDNSTAANRRRLDDVFGEVVPNTTRDERGHEPASVIADDDWYRENRPPHHDR